MKRTLTIILWVILMSIINLPVYYFVIDLRIVLAILTASLVSITICTIYINQNYQMVLLFKPLSLWLGIHYSKDFKRICINIIPCITIRCTHIESPLIYKRDPSFHMFL